MGCMQTKNHKNESDTEMFLDLDTSETNSTLRRCSTFISPFFPVSASSPGAAAATQLMATDKRPNSRGRCLWKKYDPVYMLWKNGFENAELRTPRKVSPISGKNKCVYNITGVLAGQQTPKGFPYYTILRKQMHDEEEFSDEEELSPCEGNSSRTPLLEPPSTPIVPDLDTNNEIQKEICINDISKVLPDVKACNLRANFICKKTEQQTIIKNLMAEVKQQNSERTTAANGVSVSLKKPTKRLNCKSFSRRFLNWETKIQQRKIIDLHDLGGCYYAF